MGSLLASWTSRDRDDWYWCCERAAKLSLGLLLPLWIGSSTSNDVGIVSDLVPIFYVIFASLAPPYFAIMPLMVGVVVGGVLPGLGIATLAFAASLYNDGSPLPGYFVVVGLGFVFSAPLMTGPLRKSTAMHRMAIVLTPAYAFVNAQYVLKHGIEMVVDGSGAIANVDDLIVAGCANQTLGPTTSGAFPPISDRVAATLCELWDSGELQAFFLALVANIPQGEELCRPWPSDVVAALKPDYAWLNDYLGGGGAELCGTILPGRTAAVQLRVTPGQWIVSAMWTAPVPGGTLVRSMLAASVVAVACLALTLALLPPNRYARDELRRQYAAALRTLADMAKLGASSQTNPVQVAIAREELLSYEVSTRIDDISMLTSLSMFEPFLSNPGAAVWKTMGRVKAAHAELCGGIAGALLLHHRGIDHDAQVELGRALHEAISTAGAALALEPKDPRLSDQVLGSGPQSCSSLRRATAALEAAKAKLEEAHRSGAVDKSSSVVGQNAHFAALLLLQNDVRRLLDVTLSVHSEACTPTARGLLLSLLGLVVPCLLPVLRLAQGWAAVLRPSSWTAVCSRRAFVESWWRHYSLRIQVQSVVLCSAAFAVAAFWTTAAQLFSTGDYENVTPENTPTGIEVTLTNPGVLFSQWLVLPFALLVTDTKEQSTKKSALRFIGTCTGVILGLCVALVIRKSYIGACVMVFSLVFAITLLAVERTPSAAVAVFNKSWGYAFALTEYTMLILAFDYKSKSDQYEPWGVAGVRFTAQMLGVFLTVFVCHALFPVRGGAIVCEQAGHACLQATNALDALVRAYLDSNAAETEGTSGEKADSGFRAALSAALGHRDEAKALWESTCYFSHAAFYAPLEQGRAFVALQSHLITIVDRLSVVLSFATDDEIADGSDNNVDSSTIVPAYLSAGSEVRDAVSQLLHCVERMARATAAFVRGVGARGGDGDAEFRTEWLLAERAAEEAYGRAVQCVEAEFSSQLHEAAKMAQTAETSRQYAAAVQAEQTKWSTLIMLLRLFGRSTSSVVVQDDVPPMKAVAKMA